jgi:hypothetical protein
LDPDERPTKAEICTELLEVYWLVFGGAETDRVNGEASVEPFSPNVTKAMLQSSRK